MAKPTTIPDWISDDDAAKIDTPSASKQAEGWLSGEKPPFQYFNWFWNVISKWIKWWDARTPEYNIAIDLEANEGDYETLVAYLADSPASGDRVRINIDQTLTVKMTIPAGIKLTTQKGVKITCATNLATALLEFGNTCETQGEFIIELSQTGTIVEGVAFNGDDNYHENIVIKNTSTGTLTTAFIVKASKKCNNVKGEVINSGGGTITNVLTDSSTLLSNHINIRDGVNNEVHKDAGALLNLEVTATATEINTSIDGCTATAAELNKLDGTDAITADFDKLHDIAATAAEIDAVANTGKYGTQGMILGDTTAGRVLRAVEVTIVGEADAEITASMVNKWNGAAIGTVNNIAKNETDSGFYFATDGTYLQLANAVIGGNIVGILNIYLTNKTGIIYNIDVTAYTGVGFRIEFYSSGGVGFDASTLGAGDILTVYILYLTES